MMTQMTNHANLHEVIVTMAPGMGGGMSSSDNNGSALSPKLTSWMRSRPERNLWQKDEMLEMLQIMLDMKALELLNDKTLRSELVFHEIKKIMNERGYRKKSHMQIWNKWKFLKSTYNISKRNGVIPKTIPLVVYEKLVILLDGDGLEQSNSTSSMNPSSCENSKQSSTTDCEVAASGFNGVKCGNSNSYTDYCTLGIEHPIFGYRLGVVKMEVADADNCVPPNTEKQQESNLENDVYKCRQHELTKRAFQIQQQQQNGDDHAGQCSLQDNEHTTNISTNNSTLTSTAAKSQLRVASFAKEFTPSNALSFAPLATTPPVPTAAPVPPPPLSLSFNGRTRLAVISNPQNLTLANNSKEINYTQKQEDIINYLRLQRGVNGLTSTTLPLPKKISQQPIQSAGCSPLISMPDQLVKQQATFSNTRRNDLTGERPCTSRKAYRTDRSSPVTESVGKPRKRGNNRFTFEDAQSQSQPQTQTSACDERSFERVVGEMSDTLRNVQVKMLASFFEEQMKFAKLEHDFQLRQDALIMQAFRQQTEQLLSLSKDLLGVDLTLAGDFKVPYNNNSSSNNLAEQNDFSAEQTAAATNTKQKANNFLVRNGKRQRRD